MNTDTEFSNDASSDLPLEEHHQPHENQPEIGAMDLQGQSEERFPQEEKPQEVSVDSQQLETFSKTMPNVEALDINHSIDLKQQLEALIFSSDEALSLKLIRAALDTDTLTEEQIQALVNELNEEYESTGRTFRIQRIAQGYRFLTEKHFHRPIQRLLQPKLARRLSQAALETLAIIAYKQPIAKSEIEQIRGANADYVIRVLLEKNLIEVSGRSDGVGKALLYGTTKDFLDYFNLPSLSELPKPREIDELMREGDAQEFLKQELNSRLKVELEKDAEIDTIVESTPSDETGESK